MKTKPSFRSSLALCGIIFAAVTVPAHAGLLGNIVTCAQVGVGSFSCSATSASVGNAFEFQIGTPSFPAFNVNFSDSELAVTALDGLSISGTVLQFTNATSAFASASFLSATGITGLDASDVALTSGTLRIDLRSTLWDQGETLRVSLTDGGSSTVPEPAPLALAGLGFAALVLSRARCHRAGPKGA